MTDPIPPSAAEVLGRIFPGRDLSAIAAAPPEPDDPRREAEEWNRDRALRLHILKTPQLFAQARADLPQVQDWAGAYLRTGPGARSLLLLGATGTGKTHQAYGAFRWLAGTGWPPVAWRAVEAAELFALMRPGGTPDAEAAFAALADAPLLLLDDLGAARWSEFAEEVAYRLVNARYTDALPMIVTSNVRPEAFTGTFGARIASRLREMCVLVDLGLTDRRQAPGSAA
jgi:DNA replication protein DnaC